MPPVAPWVAEARCGEAVGWLLANVAPQDPDAARALLARTVEREAALRAQAARREVSALTAELLERLTHRLRTDVTTLQAVADGALAGLFEAEDLEQLPGELQRTGRDALERLTAAREVMRAHARAAAGSRRTIVATLRAELEAAGREAVVDGAGRRAAADVRPRAGLGGLRAPAGRRPAAGDVRRRTRSERLVRDRRERPESPSNGRSAPSASWSTWVTFSRWRADPRSRRTRSGCD